MEDKLITLALDVMLMLIPALLAMGLELLRRKLGVETLRKVQRELEAKQELALLAVKFVEQTYSSFKGPAKYDRAAEWLVTRANELGLRLTTKEVQGLIEAALRTLKDEFGEQWAKTIE